MQQLQQCKVTPGTERRIFLWHFDENVTSVCVTVRHGGEAVVAHLRRTSAAFHKLLTLNTSWFRANILSAVKVCKKKKRSFVLWAPPCEWHSSYLLKWTPTSKLYRASFTLLQPKHATVRKMVWISRKFKRFITQKPSPVLVAASTITGELSVLYHCWWRDRLSKVSSCVPRTFPPVTNYNTTVCNLQLVEFMMIPFIPLNVWMPKCRMIRFDSIWRTVQKKMRPLALCRREPASPRAHRNSDMTTWDWRLSVSFSTGLSRYLDFAVMLPSASLLDRSFVDMSGLHYQARVLSSAAHCLRL